ncbi:MULTISPECIES: glutathione peroxidase [Leptolyngbya]|jgi:glutathione peroxidase|uniref:Glutathione peroxidase n=2 Tax=Leptolyngbya boryana TaxID=1184 RepID=A0A1Z4JHP4_LEPBY|nr:MULTISPECIES: glutathione peroxidase [Leptolyngbya]BAY56274.1 glutathione peroxidase [Leptolyngbya boryana NIES-2135]MBD2366380.1 glutathione peroxidase [Leptolyngbya sp. FACHB-161]MBD2372560.1 glutathione peroxidase [Leptolyngbya sp. FACHB-238]MBD2396983.1 glutathione peroxidase [Leptolyngbya sp. FACHB-239]MBD2403506.1 glutathione peroxidase [Leptolyngbya sp. FACHB-402]
MTAQASSSIYDFSANSLEGQPVSLSTFKDKVLLIVNTASQCGFTPQYQGLQSIYNKFENQGFAVLGFPCNQFGQQEPGTASEIQSFCETRFGVTFPLFEKVDVNGSNAHPLFKYLTKSAPGIFGTEGIKWNFTKFLVDRSGKVVKRYPSTTKPEEIEKDIQALL